ncbi:hypothetical protein BD310DRAFT_935288 [Dichomitus squalens]|uniref:Uncharacterized protein n=1 Tax=Dichomitus squalens TaxID=114155 RepID=A0A4Q9PKR0_9APHY|nr:hypothetical protein BD310DRAFT_935288 [Dichomitus squalens]
MSNRDYYGGGGQQQYYPPQGASHVMCLAGRGRLMSFARWLLPPAAPASLWPAALRRPALWPAALSASAPSADRLRVRSGAELCLWSSMTERRSFRNGIDNSKTRVAETDAWHVWRECVRSHRDTRLSALSPDRCICAPQNCAAIACSRVVRQALPA